MSGEELYYLYIKGDEKAFEDFVALYQDELALFINGMVGDWDEAKYLTIETFANFILNKKKFDGNSSIKTYLFAIGKNLALRFIRNRSRDQHISYEEIDEMVSDNQTPGTIFERAELKQHLYDAMLDLKEDHRTVLSLLYFEEMSYAETGRAMNKSTTQIRGLVYRAKLALKKELESRNIHGVF